MRTVLVILAFTAVGFLTSCLGTQKEMDTWVLKDHPFATMVKTYGTDLGNQWYVLCEHGTVLILQTNNLGRSDIVDTILLPSDHVSCK